MALIDAISRWNPWWAEKAVPSQLLGIKRDLKEAVKESMALRHIKDIIGIRRCGKSTLMYQVIAELIGPEAKPGDVAFVNFDDPAIFNADFEEIRNTILKNNPETAYLFVDEAQQKKGWEAWIRALYDQATFRQIFVSGSSASLLSKEISRTLTGRHLTFVLYPFSFREYLQIQKVAVGDSQAWLRANKERIQFHLSNYLEFGGFPEAADKEPRFRGAVLLGVYQDVIMRDVVSRYGVDRSKVAMVAAYMLTNMGKEYTLRSISRATNISVDAVERYLSYLEDAFLLFELPLFSYKLKASFRANKKIYAIDNGLRNMAAARVSPDTGRLAENAVFLALKRGGKDVFYWKSSGCEVDFVIAKAGLKAEQLIQVCWDIRDNKTKDREIAGLLKAMDAFGLKEGLIITEDYEADEKIGAKKIIFAPLWKWLLSPL